LGNIHAEEQTKLLPDLQSRIRYGTLAASLNFSPLQKTVVTQKKNFFLPLKQPADSLFSRFREDTKSRIRKAADHHLTYSTNQSDAHTDLSKIIHLYSAHLKYKRTALAPAALHKLLHFCALFPQSWIIRKVLHKQEQLMAAALLLRTDTRLYNLINITVPEGRALCANHFLLWKMMEEFSPSDSDASDAKTDNALVFDFEGSSLPGVAEFYKGFNPHEEAYWLYHYNHLPFPFSWL
jgi:lipid II:glycine glycyltransferase (peptidoglycan interpeptide bridge formation enzyme)